MNELSRERRSRLVHAERPVLNRFTDGSSASLCVGQIDRAGETHRFACAAVRLEKGSLFLPPGCSVATQTPSGRGAQTPNISREV